MAWLAGDALQFATNLSAGAIAVVGFAAQQAMDQRREPVRQRRPQPSEIGGVAIETGQGRVGVGLTQEGHSAGKTFVQHEAERVQVGAAVQLAAAHLLGREVLGGAHHHVRAGEVVVAAAEALGDAEVGEQYPTIRGDEDVAGLHVAMHEVCPVRAVERRRDAGADVHGEVGAEALLLVEQLPQAFAVDQLHDHGLPLLAADRVVDRVVDGDDVGVAELGDGDGLAPEAFGDDGVGRKRRFEQLDGHLAGQRQVGAQPNLGHASLREPTLQPVALDEYGGGQRSGVRARSGG